MKGPLRAARFWFQFALTGGFLILLAWRVDIGDALATLPQANWAWVPLGLIIFTLSKAVHTARWRIFLGRERKLPFPGLLGLFWVHNLAHAVPPPSAGAILPIQSSSPRSCISRPARPPPPR